MHPTAGTAASDKLYNVQILRFFAAFLVLVDHGFAALSRGYLGTETEIHFPILWRSGVDIFFIISGFIMLHTSGDQFGKPGAARKFLSRRLVRIVPLYWLFTSLMLVVTLTQGSHLNNATVDPAHVLSSYAFFPSTHPNGGWTPLLGPGWTLNYEMMFYALFAAGLLFPPRIGAALIGGAFALLVILGRVFDFSFVAMAFWTQPIILEFLLGIGLALVYKRGIRLGRWPRLGLIALGLVLGGFAEVNDPAFGTRVLWAGIPSLLIAAGVILGPNLPATRLRGWLVLLGDASYALYLSHLFTLKAVGIALGKVGVSSPWIFLLIGIPTGIAASVLIYRYVERPMLSVAKRLSGLRRRRPGDASGHAPIREAESG